MAFSTMVMAAAPWMIWISWIWLKSCSSEAEDQRAHHHADEQHHIEQAPPRAAVPPAGEVIGQRKSRRLRGMDAGTHQQESQRRTDLAVQAEPCVRR
jgi:hypothetical protein